MKTLATLALATFATVAASAAANADAMSDQKKAYNAIGIKVHGTPPLCKLMSKAEVERFLGGPVKDGVSGPMGGCAWYLVKSPSDGMFVMRNPRAPLDHPSDPSYRKVTGVGEQAYTVHAAYGYEADALNAKGVTSVIMHTDTANAAKALAVLRVAMNR
jgi:hypothetical protein